MTRRGDRPFYNQTEHQSIKAIKFMLHTKTATKTDHYLVAFNELSRKWELYKRESNGIIFLFSCSSEQQLLKNQRDLEQCYA